MNNSELELVGETAAAGAAYYDFLAAVLRPLRVYDLVNGVGADELRALGGAMDELLFEIQAAEREAVLETAVDCGIEGYRSLLPYVPEYDDVDETREAIKALLRIDGGCFTIPALNATISGCGMSASVTEADKPQTVEVSFKTTRGVPDNFDEIKQRVEAILPCHLGVTYQFAFIRWRELEVKLRDWAAVEAVKNWQTLEML